MPTNPRRGAPGIFLIASLDRLLVRRDRPTPDGQAVRRYDFYNHGMFWGASAFDSAKSHELPWLVCFLNQDLEFPTALSTARKMMIMFI